VLSLRLCRRLSTWDQLSRCPKNIRKSRAPQFVSDLILKIRTDNKNYGKEKITRTLIRDHNIKLSCSTVGRILKSLIENGKIRKYRASLKTRHKRRFDEKLRLSRFSACKMRRFILLLSSLSQLGFLQICNKPLFRGAPFMLTYDSNNNNRGR